MNHNLLIKPRETDYTIGDGHITFKAVTNGDWTPHIAFYEAQKFSWDTDGCVCFTAQESFDAQMDALWQTLPVDIQSKIIDMGFLDVGLDSNMHFHSSARFIEIMTGNGINGNSIPETWDVIRKYGCLPWKDLPFNETMTQEEYFTPMTQAQLQKASSFLALLGGKNAVLYHWMTDGGIADRAIMQSALLQAPLCLGIAVGQSWNQTIPSNPPTTDPPAHSVMCYNVNVPSVDIYDHYEPRYKVLDASYPIHYVLQGIVNPIITPTPNAIPILPIRPTVMQEQTWLTQVTEWLKKVLVSLQK